MTILARDLAWRESPMDTDSVTGIGKDTLVSLGHSLALPS